MFNTARMDHGESTHPSTARLELETRAAGNVARHLARERQKRELREERDRLVLDLARELGEQGLAQRLGVSAAVTGKLLAGARNRLDLKLAASPALEITARRLSTGGERWADADAHYAELGSGLVGGTAAAL